MELLAIGFILSAFLICAIGIGYFIAVYSPSVKLKYPIFKIHATDLHEGDVIVLQHKGRLSSQAVISISASFKHLFPGHRVLILEDEMKLSLLKNQPAENSQNNNEHRADNPLPMSEPEHAESREKPC
jgi:hypothetical protein